MHEVLEWIPLLRQNDVDLNPPEKSKTPTKYKHVFITNEWLLHTYDGIVGTFMVWNYGI